MDNIKRITADFYIRNNAVVSHEDLAADTLSDESDSDSESGEDEAIDVIHLI